MDNLLKKSMCPTTRLPGWWWKKHFAYYRGIKETFDTMLLKDWMNGGYERHMEKMKQALESGIFGVFNAGFKTTYTEKDFGDTIVIVPSGRIDYCSQCKKDHGYDCPLDEIICKKCGKESVMMDRCHIHGTPECYYCGECQFKEPYGDERDNA